MESSILNIDSSARSLNRLYTQIIPFRKDEGYLSLVVETRLVVVSVFDSGFLE